MTDLLSVLPHFPVGQFARLIPALEKHGISTSDLLTLEAADIGKRTHLPLLDVRRLSGAVLDALHADLGVATPAPGARSQQQRAKSASESEAGPESDDPAGHGDRAAPEHAEAPGAASAGSTSSTSSTSALKNTAASLAAQWQTISTLDPELDRALGGGIPAGYVTEITGESGAGKTQFLLTLLLSVQLPPPHGLGRPALYISTEAPLSTRRLAQMLSANPLFQRLPAAARPSLDNIISTATPDLESQDHILTFQVPVEVERRGIGLVVIDSVAANYRAEFERSAQHGSNMGARTAELVKLGMHLRGLAQRHNLAVVVSNQVADRFSSNDATTTTTTANLRTPSSSLHHHHHRYLRPPLPPQRATQESPLATRSRLTNPGPQQQLPSSSLPAPSSPQEDPPPPPPPALLVPHQTTTPLRPPPTPPTQPSSSTTNNAGSQAGATTPPSLPRPLPTPSGCHQR
ncbi:9a5af240-87a0-446f-9d5e-da31b4d12c8f [Thermothielavioides terrestris]|uniref:9a5af240-87a0-446f-9d5e-da31b4d12c8f n=1 Tax=Thermothielavioides terrestris TaxID=2587410 RepID=A0A3S4CCR6_9PEZI|nr:9a5af240-87a0-446f-9d5e-da31b4d12c8f [Thermothielavioides terrestris]